MIPSSRDILIRRNGETADPNERPGGSVSARPRISDSTKSANRLAVDNLISGAVYEPMRCYRSGDSDSDSSNGSNGGSCSRDLKAVSQPPFLPSTHSRSWPQLFLVSFCLLHAPWTSSFSAQAGRLNVVLIK